MSITFMFAVIIIISVVFYIYYKVAILRTRDELTQKYFNSKARVFLGTFMFAFGVNQYIAYQTKFILLISVIFIFLGGLQMFDGFRAAKHYRSEYRRLHPNE